MGKSSAPAAPDPRETSAASTSTNIGTAVANNWMGNISENTPDGSTTVSQTGSHTWDDPYTGKSYEIPTFTRDTVLSDAQQAIKDQQDQANLGLSTLGNNQTQFLQDYLSTPFDGSSEATENRLNELGRERLDPLMAQQDEALRTRLANQGIKAGSEAYDREMALQSQSHNDANNQLILNGWGQSFQQGQAERNQPINEITALLSGSQVSQPQFQGANMSQIPTTDVAGLINENYNQRYNAYQQDTANRNAIMGGLFGLGGKMIGLSDVRAKENIEAIGEVKGHTLYEYNYKGGFDDGDRHVGVMAQEAEQKRPDAVKTGADGLKRVDYGALGLGKLFSMGVGQ